MQGSLDQPPITLRGSRRGGAAFLVFGLLLTGAGALAVVGPKVSPAGVGFFIFGLLLFFVGVKSVVSPAQLSIGPGGLELNGALGSRRFAWDEVAAFRVVQLRRARLIGFDRTGTAARNGLFRDLAAALTPANISSAYDAAIPGKWPSVAAEDLVELLNDARHRWGGVQAARALELRPRSSSGQRIDRRLYWLAIGLLMSISVLLSALTHGGRVTGGLTLLSIWITARRLHDIGRSGWWQAAVLAGQIALGIVLIAGLHWSPQAALGPLVLVQLAFAVGLGAIPGDPAANRFGAPPGAPGLEPAAEVFR